MPRYDYRDLIASKTHPVYDTAAYGHDLESAVSAADGAGGGTVLVTAALAPDDDVTVPAGVTLAFTSAGSVTVADTKNLDLSASAVVAPAAATILVLDGSGTVTLPEQPIPCSWFGSFNLAVAAVAAQTRTLLVEAAYTGVTNATVPATCAVEIARGGSIDVAVGNTVTLSGPVTAPAVQVFPGSGAAVPSALQPLKAEWWPSITKAVADIGSATRRLVVSASTTLTQSVTVPSTLKLEIDKSAVVTVNGGVTLTLSSRPIIDSWAAFSVSGTLSLSFTTDCWSRAEDGPWRPHDSAADQGSTSTVGTVAWLLAKAAGAKLSIEFLPGKTYTFDTNTTVPATCTLLPQQGALITVAASDTLTVNGQIVAGSYRVFDASAAGSYALSNVPGGVNVQWFGAIPDGSATDFSAEVQAAFDAAEGGEVYFPHVAYVSHGASPSGGYPVSSAVSLPPNTGLVMHAPLLYTGSANETCLTVGDNTAATQNRRFRLGVVRSTLSDWTNDGSIGIDLARPNACDIEIFCANRFTVGVRVIGDGGGCAYNTTRLGDIRQNKYGLWLYRVNSGWVNENLWIGGRFSQLSGTNTGLDRYGVRVTDGDDAGANNNNVFLKPSFELIAADAAPGEAVPVLMEHGQLNSFLDCRDEGNDTTYFVKESSPVTMENFYELGWRDSRKSISWAADIANFTSVIVDGRSRAGAVNRASWRSVAMHKEAIRYGAASYHVPGCHLTNSSGTTMTAQESGLTAGTDYLTLSNTRAVGVVLDTRRAKRFIVRRDVESSYGARVMFRCYDGPVATGTILNSGGGNHPYATGWAHTALSYNATHGGVYRTGSDGDSPVMVVFHDDVKEAVVLIGNGTAELRIRSFSIECIDYGDAPTVWSGVFEPFAGCHLGTQAPVDGTHAQGQIVIAAAPSSGGFIGWVCTAAGTPGTWKTWGAIS